MDVQSLLPTNDRNPSVKVRRNDLRLCQDRTASRIQLHHFLESWLARCDLVTQMETIECVRGSHDAAIGTEPRAASRGLKALSINPMTRRWAR
jgi:hypothetical protein